jgi:hypothetical protein
MNFVNVSYCRAWKIKARRWLGAPNGVAKEKFRKTIESSRAKQILLEGNTIAFASRLKDVLKIAIGPFDIAADEAAVAAEGGKKGAKAAASGSGNLTIDEYLPYSSGEEEEEEHPDTPAYTPLPSIYFAPSLESMWPQRGDSPVTFEPYASSYRHIFIYDSKGMPLCIGKKRLSDAAGEKITTNPPAPPPPAPQAHVPAVAKALYAPTEESLAQAAATIAAIIGGVGLNSVPVLVAQTPSAPATAAPATTPVAEDQSVDGNEGNEGDEGDRVAKKLRTESPLGETAETGNSTEFGSAATAQE